MADPKPTLQSLEPISLILSQHSLGSVPLQLTSDTYTMERGPRYRAYAELRDSKLRMNNLRHQECKVCDLKQTTPKKQVKFQARKGYSYSVLAQSVPDFSATLRKENRKPPELTPPSKKCSKVNTILSKSANGGEKRNGMARKSYASVEELKGLSMAASAAINGGRVGREISKTVTVLGYSHRQLY
ncbi:uncharacterized protein [Euphorbia lathyris]|uniref:uncharacterized protein n=1 Tax=Euphorbia lathyris TaxID=212925 RepID=UPI00331408B0